MLFEILFVFSLVINLFLLLYCVRIARRMFVVGANLQTLYDSIDLFREHVVVVHESEMFYGDQTLQNLIEHSKEVINILETYDDVMSLVIMEDEDVEERNVDGEEE